MKKIKSVSDKVFTLNTLFKVKSVGEGEDTSIKIEGIANSTTKDRVGDVILSEAWTKGGLDNYLKNPIVLAYHDHSKPIGKTIEYGVNNGGLHIVAEITKSAGDIYNLIKENILKSFSVGIRVKDADYDSQTDIFVIKDLELYEISVVSVPANADSLFSVRKSFNTEEEYLKFKSLFKTESSQNKEGNSNTIKGDTKVGDDNKLSLTAEELESMKQKAVEEALAKIEKDKADKDAIAALAATAGKSGAEELIKDISKKLEDENTNLKSVIEQFKSEIEEKKKEFESISKSKMVFEDKGNVKVNEKDILNAVLLSKITNKSIDATKFGKTIIEKAGAHMPVANIGADWENLFSTRMYEEVMDKLIVEPLFTQRIQMNSRTLTIPYNPEAGYGQWIADTAYNTSNSTGTASTHVFKDIILKAEKLASKEYIGYEEEEDAIIPLLPLINAAVVRRMARSTDTELLRANAGANSGSGNAPTGFNGIATLAVDNSKTVSLGGTLSATDLTTVADLQRMRRVMGRYGMNPSDVVYIVNETAYYDLLEDPDFRTIDLVGANATILRGQIGMANGSRVIVSDSFAAKAANTACAVAVNVNNYLFGELRGLGVERDKDIEAQRNIIVATRRFAFSEIVPSTGSCVALLNPAS